MKTKYIISLMVLLIALSFQSCDDFLKEENLSNMTAEDFYLSKDGYTSLVYSVYPEWKQIYGRTDPWLFFAGTDIYVIGVEHGGPIDLQRYSTLNPGSEGIELHYKQCFKIIQRTNMALYYSDLTDKSNPDLDKFIGEMKFHRAFAYFLLVQGYGGVPKIDYYVADAVTSLERDSAEEIYELIVKDLEDALVKLPDIAYSDAQGRIVKRAAQHLLAKVYLTRGYEDFGSNDDFTKAAQLADQAITGQGLDIPFAELWEPGNEFNAEVLFSIQYSKEVTAGNPNNGNNQASTIGGGSYMGGGNETVHKDGICVPSRYCYSLFEEGDDRWEGTFMTEQYVRYRDFWEDTPDRTKIKFFFAPPWFTSADSAAYRAANPQLDESIFTYKTFDKNSENCYVYDRSEGGNALDNLSIKKFDDPISQNGKTASVRDIVLFRLAETYLIAAEAYLQAGQAAKGLERLNAVRNRAGATLATLAEFDIYYILEERGRELLGEYKRWYDLKRTGKLEELAVAHNYDVVAGAFDGYNGNKRYLRPIPQSALDLNQNKNFPQNPAYVP